MANMVLLRPQVQHGSSSVGKNPSSSSWSSTPTSNLCPASRPASRRVQGFRSLTGFAFPSSGVSTASLAGSRSSSASHAAHKFRPFSRYRSRRSSDGSLTDLSPPTDSDLGHDYTAALSAAEMCEDSTATNLYGPNCTSDSSISPLLRSPFALHKFAQDSQAKAYGSGSLHRSESISSSRHLCRRLLTSKHARTGQPNSKNAPSDHKTDLPFFHKTSLSFSLPRESENVELIGSPSQNRTRLAPESSCALRSHSSFESRASTSTRSAHGSFSRSSSSPNLHLSTSSFSHRPSSESDERRNSICSNRSPRRGKAPPPIRVPNLKYKPSTIAIVDESDDQVTPSAPKFSARHRPTGSDGNLLQTRQAAMGWSTFDQDDSKLLGFGVRTTTSETKVHRRESYLSAGGAFDEATSLSASRSIHISLSSPTKFPSDRIPAVKPLQPAPRKFSAVTGSTCTPEVRNKALPVMISRHSRALPAPLSSSSRQSSFSSSPRLSSEELSPSQLDPTPSVESCQIANVSNPLSSIPSGAAQFFRRVSMLSTRPSFPLEAHDESEERTSTHNQIIPPQSSTIPFPTSRGCGTSEPSAGASGSSTASNRAFASPINLSPPTSAGTHCFFSPSENKAPLPYRSRLASDASFDIRNLPVFLESSSDTLYLAPAITVPQLPQLVCSAFPANDRQFPDTPAQFQRPANILQSQQRGELRSVASDISNTSSTTTNRCAIHFSTPSVSSASESSAHDPPKAASGTEQAKSRPPTRRYSRPRSSSADGCVVDLMGPSHQHATELTRPRSMSAGTLEINNRKLMLFHERGEEEVTLPRSAPSETGSAQQRPYLLSLFAPRSPIQAKWTTRSIATHLRDLAPAQLTRNIEEALQLFSPDSNRFFVGDMRKIVSEAREHERQAKQLHNQHFRDQVKREKLLQRHVATLRAFNGDQGARFGEALLKAVTHGDKLTLELLALIDHTSRIEKTCEAHWRAATVTQIRLLKIKDAQLEASGIQIRQLNATRHLQAERIAELEAQLSALEQSLRPDSRSTIDSAHVDSNSGVPRALKHSREGIIFRRGAMPPSSIKPNPHNRVVSPGIKSPAGASWSPIRWNLDYPGSAGTSAGNSWTENSLDISPKSPLSRSHRLCSMDSLGDSQSIREVPLSTSCNSAGDSHSPKLSISPLSLGQGHNWQFDKAREATMQTIPPARVESGPHRLSISRANAPNVSSLIPFPTVAPTPRFDSIKNKRPGILPLNLATRSIFTPASTIKPKTVTNNSTLILGRSSSFNSIDNNPPGVSNSVNHQNVLAPSLPDTKALRDISPASLPPAAIQQPQIVTRLPRDSSLESHNSNFQGSQRSESPSPSQITRENSARPLRPIAHSFTTPGLPPPSSTGSRRKMKWPQGGSSGNLSSITLSQLGSLDIANLLTDLELLE